MKLSKLTLLSLVLVSLVAAQCAAPATTEAPAAGTEAQAETLHLTDALREAEARLREVQAAQQDLTHKEHQLDDLTRRLDQRERALAAVSVELEQAQVQIQAYETILHQADEIEAGYTCWTEARDADAAYNALLARQTELLEKRAKLERTLAATRSEYVAQQSALNRAYWAALRDKSRPQVEHILLDPTPPTSGSDQRVAPLSLHRFIAIGKFANQPTAASRGRAGRGRAAAAFDSLLIHQAKFGPRRNELVEVSIIG